METGKLSPKTPDGKFSPPNLSQNSPYQKIEGSHKVFLAYVVAIRDSLNYHLDIYWDKETELKYNNSLSYDYTFVSEELEKGIHTRKAYSCHLRGVELVEGVNNLRESYVMLSKKITDTNGWVLVSVNDIDVFRRILVNIFHLIQKYSFNLELLHKISEKTGEPIAKEYIRPSRSKTMFQPSSLPSEARLIF